MMSKTLLNKSAPEPRQSTPRLEWWIAARKDGVRVFEQVVRLEVVSGKCVLSRPGRAPGGCPIPPTSTSNGHT
ncbi:MAG TPA: hypothetical protein VFQ23_09420 [Anaerolineales bacterium]|nr:hypothetical protein [Anaerolineales bacterium]